MGLGGKGGSSPLFGVIWGTGMRLGGLFWEEMGTAGKQGRIPAPHGQGMEKCLPIASKTRGFPQPRGDATPPCRQEEAAADSVPRGN